MIMEACCLVSIHAPFQRVISNSKASDNNTEVLHRSKQWKIIKQELAISDDKAVRQELVMNDLGRPLCFIAIICYVDRPTLIS
jgi:hypothetical protein